MKLHTRNPNEQISNYDGFPEKLIASCTCGWIAEANVYRGFDHKRQARNKLTEAWAGHMRDLPLPPEPPPL